MTSSLRATDPDPDDVVKLTLTVWGYKQGELVSLMIHLGHRLGLYRELAGVERVTSHELAERTGLAERWLREWLHGQAAAGLLEHDDGRFLLTDAGVAVLVDDQGSLAYSAGAFTEPPTAPEVVAGLADAFRTGIGLSYDQRGPGAAHQTEQMLGPWIRLALVPTILPALDGVVGRLEAGATVADVGCGAGTALVAMAERYPASRFEGYDNSRHAIARAEANIAASHASNVHLNPTDGGLLPTEPTFDLVLTFDCLHDMTHPDVVAAAIRRAIRDDGVWLIKDIRCGDTFDENRKNPMLAMMYGLSIAGCMSSAASEPVGAALGTLGLPPSAMERLVSDAGFTRFVVHDFDDAANLYYEVRP